MLVTVAWPSDETPTHRVRLRLEAAPDTGSTRRGAVQCAALTVESLDPRHRVTAATMRAIPLARLLADALEAAERSGAALGIPRRRPRHGPQHLDAVARCYIDAWRADERPTTAVAQRWNVNVTTAKRWVHRARIAGLLPPTIPGVASGHVLKKQRLCSNCGQEMAIGEDGLGVDCFIAEKRRRRSTSTTPSRG
jgi:hypothetical protein